MSVAATQSAASAQAILTAAGSNISSTNTTSTRIKADGSIVEVVEDAKGNILSEAVIVTAAKGSSAQPVVTPRHVDVSA